MFFYAISLEEWKTLCMSNSFVNYRLSTFNLTEGIFILKFAVDLEEEIIILIN